MAAPAESDWGSRRHVQTIAMLALSALALYLCMRMALPFLPALAAALSLAALFAPLQARFERRLRHAGLAAGLSLLLIGSIVVVPASFVVQQLATQALEGARVIQERVATGQWRQSLASQPRLALWATRIEQQLDLPATATRFANWLSNTAGRLLKGSIYQLLGFVLTFYLLFFFLRDRLAAVVALRALLPLSAAESDRLLLRINDTIHATVYGILAVAAVQGLLGGLMFWWLGLSAPLLWGTVMALLAVVPVLGAFVVWIPAALVLALDGDYSRAMILCVWGVLVIGTANELLRPYLVGNRLQQHTVLVFISVVGGLIVFGPAGLILGPVTLSISMVLLEIWAARGRVEARDGLQDLDEEAKH